MFSKKIISSIAIISFVGLLNSCGSSDSAGPVMGPQKYKVVSTISQDLDLYSEYPASLEGMQDVEIRPKLDGYIETIYVDEGAAVKKGQKLFKISNPQYEQTARNAEASVQVAKVALENAELVVEKTIPLVKKGIVSEYDLKVAKLDVKSKEAALAQAQATLANARTNVSYLTIASPIEGLLGELPHKLGSYVSASTQTPLTTVSNISKIYAYFSLNEKQQLRYLQATDETDIEKRIKSFPPVELILADGSVYPQKGNIETISGQVNSSTGSFSVRVTFDNQYKILRSGNSGTLRIYNLEENVITIPQNATFETQGKYFAFIVNDDNTVRLVEVKVRPVPGGQFYIVDEGIKEGQKIVIEGVSTLKDETTIVPEVVDTKSIYTTEK